MTTPDTTTPISPPNVWDLKASPPAVQQAAGSWRALYLTATSAHGTAGAAANQVLGDGVSWVGSAAEAYDEHRTKLLRDVEWLAEQARQVADALDALTWVLQGAQNQLTESFARLTAIVPHTWQGDRVLFQPIDLGQQTAVTEAITAATEIRAGVDEELVMKEATFDLAMTEISTITSTWRERTVRLVNLNIGQGHDNLTLNIKAGVGPEEVGELADLLDGQNADIVTLQEVFQEDLGRLEKDLEDRTGDVWNVHFTEAAMKPHVTDVWSAVGIPLEAAGDFLFGEEGVPDDLSQPFGNAVLVREGDLIEGSETVDEIRLSEPGDGEGRSVIQAAVTYRQDD